ncbi:ELM1/GtrOC1 family putative glycosyltransferase, partial [Oharaeibacter diazotrophicus]
SRHHRFDAAATAALVGGLAALADGGAGLMITTSRRTPPALVAALTELSARPGVRLWTGGPDNPLPAYLALADSVVVTADSTNMVGEAAATGAPLHVFRPPGGHPRIDRFLAALGRVATLRPFPGPLGGASYPPVDATPAMAEAIRARFAALRMGLTGSAPPARS